jgi:hypothetical protein
MERWSSGLQNQTMATLGGRRLRRLRELFADGRGSAIPGLRVETRGTQSFGDGRTQAARRNLIVTDVQLFDLEWALAMADLPH